jgi:hypothetical protein
MKFYLPFCGLDFHRPDGFSVRRMEETYAATCKRCAKPIYRVGPKHWKAAAEAALGEEPLQAVAARPPAKLQLNA